MNHLPQIQEIAADVFELLPEELTPSSSPETVPRWDSLQHLNLVMALEQAFGVEFTPEEIEGMTSLEAVGQVLAAKNGSVITRRA